MAIHAAPMIRVGFAVAFVVVSGAPHAALHAASPESDAVSLSESSIPWSTLKYATTPDNGFVDGSLDRTVIVDRTFRTRVQASRASLQFVSVEPAAPLRVTLKRGDAVMFDEAVTADPKNGNHISTNIPSEGHGDQVQLTIRTADGKELIAAEAKIR